MAHVMNSRRQRAKAKVSVSHAPVDVLKSLDEVTSVDSRVYRAAVLRVLCDLKALERATGSKVLCAGSSSVEKLYNKTRHLTELWDGTAGKMVVDEWAGARVGYS